MIADFTITIHRDDRPDRAVQVLVHDNVYALRSAVTQYGRKHGTGKAEKGLLGVCHRFHMEGVRTKQGKQVRTRRADALCAIVRLAPPDIGIGIVVHELAHAAVWIQEIDDGFKDTPLVCQNDEDFCWNLGDLVRQTVNKFYEKGIYPG